MGTLASLGFLVPNCTHKVNNLKNIKSLRMSKT
uniref:Uncharacterized protein n=1 Tax=Anguilla anguilla TaxID=7936 RepID=A0A0E9UN35_ANGAN